MGVLRLGEVKEHTSGGSPLYNKVKLNFMSAFFFETRGTNENCFAALSRSRTRLPSLGKKEMQKKRFASAEATNAPRVGSAVAFWKKRRKNFRALSHLTVR